MPTWHFADLLATKSGARCFHYPAVIWLGVLGVCGDLSIVLDGGYLGCGCDVWGLAAAGVAVTRGLIMPCSIRLSACLCVCVCVLTDPAAEVGKLPLSLSLSRCHVCFSLTVCAHRKNAGLLGDSCPLVAFNINTHVKSFCDFLRSSVTNPSAIVKIEIESLSPSRTNSLWTPLVYSPALPSNSSRLSWALRSARDIALDKKKLFLFLDTPRSLAFLRSSHRL